MFLRVYLLAVYASTHIWFFSIFAESEDERCAPEDEICFIATLHCLIKHHPGPLQKLEVVKA